MQVLTVEKDLHATHVSFWFLCLTFHDLVKLKIFLYGSHFGGYAFYGVLGWLDMWMGDWAGKRNCLKISGWHLGRGFTGNVIPPLLFFPPFFS